jgi:hypothetical protein
MDDVSGLIIFAMNHGNFWDLSDIWFICHGFLMKFCTYVKALKLILPEKFDIQVSINF